MSDPLIGTVKRLAERQKSDASSTYQSEFPEFRYECDMLNAAPKMLDVLSQFEAGDSQTLQFFLSQINVIAPRDFESEMSKADYLELEEVLVRMQKAAHAMECDVE